MPSPAHLHHPHIPRDKLRRLIPITIFLGVAELKLVNYSFVLSDKL